MMLKSAWLCRICLLAATVMNSLGAMNKRETILLACQELRQNRANNPEFKKLSKIKLPLYYDHKGMLLAPLKVDYIKGSERYQQLQNQLKNDDSDSYFLDEKLEDLLYKIPVDKKIIESDIFEIACLILLGANPHVNTDSYAYMRWYSACSLAVSHQIFPLIYFLLEYGVPLDDKARLHFVRYPNTYRYYDIILQLLTYEDNDICLGNRKHQTGLLEYALSVSADEAVLAYCFKHKYVLHADMDFKRGSRLTHLLKWADIEFPFSYGCITEDSSFTHIRAEKCLRKLHVLFKARHKVLKQHCKVMNKRIESAKRDNKNEDVQNYRLVLKALQNPCLSLDALLKMLRGNFPEERYVNFDNYYDVKIK